MTLSIIIPMAGKGQRFVNAGITTPKPLIQVKNKTLIEHSIDSVRIKDSKLYFVVKNFDDEKHNKDLQKILYQVEGSNHVMAVGVQNGAAHTCLFAESHIKEDNALDSPLIIVNCDQILNINFDDFFNFIEKNDPDGVVVTYKSDNPKNSYAKINKFGLISEIVEKEVISSNALVGLHYWKKAKDFFDSAKMLCEKSTIFCSTSEIYVSETYNFLIRRGKKILAYEIPNEGFIPLGTPEDVDIYLNLEKVL